MRKLALLLAALCSFSAAAFAQNNVWSQSTTFPAVTNGSSASLPLSNDDLVLMNQIVNGKWAPKTTKVSDLISKSGGCTTDLAAHVLVVCGWGALPTVTVPGGVVYNTSTHKLYANDNTSWRSLAFSDTLPSLFNTTTAGIVPASGGGTVNYLRADGTWSPIGVPQMAAATIKGNPTASLTSPADFTIQGLTDASTPNATSDWMLIYNAASGTFKKVNATELQAAVSSVTSFNGRTGAVVPASGDYSSDKLTTVTSGTAPAAGKIGEVKESIVPQASPVSQTNNTIFNMTSVSLTAGSWGCTSSMTVIVGAGSTLKYTWTSISSTSLTNNAANETDVYANNAPAGNYVSVIGQNSVFDVSATTTIYLVGQYAHSTNSTASTANGRLTCVRKA